MTAPYVFVEFPKWVRPEGADPVLIHSAEQEASVLGAASPVQPDDKETLQAEAARLGVKVDRRWSVDRLQTEIDAALAAPPAPEVQE
jgi:hypothetical protein